MATKVKEISLDKANEALDALLAERNKIEARQVADQAKADALTAELPALHAAAIRKPTPENKAIAEKAEGELSAVRRALKGYNLALGAIDGEIDQAEAAVDQAKTEADKRQIADVWSKAIPIADDVDRLIAELAAKTAQLRALNDELPQLIAHLNVRRMDVSQAIQDRLEVAGLVKIERHPYPLGADYNWQPSVATMRAALHLDGDK